MQHNSKLKTRAQDLRKRKEGSGTSIFANILIVFEDK